MSDSLQFRGDPRGDGDGDAREVFYEPVVVEAERQDQAGRGSQGELSFARPIKVSMGATADRGQIVSRSVNPRDVSYMFQQFARGIHAKVHKEDPNLLKLSIACARVSHAVHYPYINPVIAPRRYSRISAQPDNSPSFRYMQSGNWLFT